MVYWTDIERVLRGPVEVAVDERARLVPLVAVGIECEGPAILASKVAEAHQMNGIPRALTVRVDVAQRTAKPHVQAVVLAGVVLRGMAGEPGTHALLYLGRDLRPADVRVVDPGHRAREPTPWV